MTTAPLILGLKHRLSTERPNTSGYSAFTTSYDEVLTEDELAKMHADLSAEEKSGLTAAMDEFESSFAAERIKIAEAGGDTIQHLKASINEQEREGTVVSFLIDHSGSMKGLRMVSALLALETAVDVLRNSNIATEILGFTTKTGLEETLGRLGNGLADQVIWVASANFVTLSIVQLTDHQPIHGSCEWLFFQVS